MASAGGDRVTGTGLVGLLLPGALLLTLALYRLTASPAGGVGRRARVQGWALLACAFAYLVPMLVFLVRLLEGPT